MCRASRLPIDQWARHRELINHLYIGQGKTLNEVVDIMQREHSFYATPRQYTQKLKSWHLRKNVRRSGVRKPRYVASIYKSPPGVGQARPNPKSVQGSPDPGTACMPAIGKASGHVGTRFEEPFLRNETSVIRNAENNPRALHGPTEAIGLDFNVLSSTFRMDEYSRFLTGFIPSEPMNTAEAMLVGSPLGAGSMASNCTSAPKDFKKPSFVVQAIWALWYRGDHSRLDDLANAMQFHHPQGVGLHQLYSGILDLGDWLALYPRNEIAQLQHRAQFSATWPKAPFLTGQAYAQYGRTVALKRALRPVYLAQTVEEEDCIPPLVRELVASMLLAQDGSSYLRRCLSQILKFFQAKLTCHCNTYKAPCLRIAQYLSPELSASNEDQYRDSATAMLAMICNREFEKASNDDYLALKSMEAYSKAGIQLSMAQVVVWACRFILYYADTALQGFLLPLDLCLTALDGCQRVLDEIGSCIDDGNRCRMPANGKPSSLYTSRQDSRFANLWAEWICYDSSFFFRDSLI